MLRDLGLLDADVAGAGQGYPRSRLLLMRRCTRSVGITPLLIGCSATDRVQRCTAWAWWTPACAVPARRTACKLVADEAVHPIRRHYTPSDRVQRDGSGVARRIGCSATDRVQRCTAGPCWMLTCAVSARKPACKLVADEALHPIRKIQPLLIGLNLP